MTFAVKPLIPEKLNNTNEDNCLFSQKKKNHFLPKVSARFEQEAKLAAGISVFPL